MADKEEYTCSECGKNVSENDNACPHCGADLSEIEGLAEVQTSDASASGASSIKKELISVLSVLSIKNGYYVTLAIIYFILLFFISMTINGVNILFPDAVQVLSFGANYTPLTLDGQWWRLFMYGFIHFGIIHLLINILALAYIGSLLEKMLGKFLYITSYLLCGLLAGVTSVFGNQEVISAGASGAIFGMFGIFIALSLLKQFDIVKRNQVLKTAGIFIVLNLLLGIKGYNDLPADIGGLLGGIAIGFLFYPALKHPHSFKIKAGVVLLSITLAVVFCGLLLLNTSMDIIKYNNKMKIFHQYELNATQALLFQSEPNADAELQMIQEMGIDNLEKGIKIIEEADKLNLPPKMHERNKIIAAFCNAKIDFYCYYYNCIKKREKENPAEVEALTQKLDSLLNRLNNED